MNTDMVKGKTLLWTFEDGPMAGKTFEHKFGADGSVKWRSVDGEAPASAGKSKKPGDTPTTVEKKYEAEQVSDQASRDSEPMPISLRTRARGRLRRRPS